MGRLGGLITSLAVAGCLMGGCGDDDGEPPEFSGTDEEQVAATVREVADAMEAGDGDAACPLITDEGQEILVNLVNHEIDGTQADDCGAAIEAVAGTGFDGNAVSGRPADVYIDEDDEDAAQIDCGDGRNVWSLIRTGDGWRVVTPFCHD